MVRLMQPYNLTQLAVPGAYRIEGPIHTDSRGSFVAPIRSNSPRVVLRNYANVYVSYNTSKYTLRGFHMQRPPYGENKIVTAITGSALHVIVTIDSHRNVVVSHNHLNSKNISTFVPANSASAFLTLEPDTTILYLSDSPYNSESAEGYLWNDPAIGFDWGVTLDQLTISERDLNFPLI